MKRNLNPWVKTCVLTLAASVLVTACEGPMPGRFTRLGQPYPAKANDYNIEVFQDAPPSKPFTEIARFDVHMEEAFFAQPTLKDIMPELLRQARLSGADAIINIQERKSVLNETKILHVTATGIKFADVP